MLSFKPHLAISLTGGDRKLAPCSEELPFILSTGSLHCTCLLRAQAMAGWHIQLRLIFCFMAWFCPGIVQITRPGLNSSGVVTCRKLLPWSGRHGSSTVGSEKTSRTCGGGHLVGIYCSLLRVGSGDGRDVMMISAGVPTGEFLQHPCQ